MIILLIVLAIYALLHFSVSNTWLYHASHGVVLPNAREPEEILPGVNVTIGGGKVSVDGLTAAYAEDAWKNENYFADDIVEKLSDVKRSVQPYTPATMRFARITLRADRNTPFKLIRNVMHAAKLTGYPELQFVVTPRKP
jgi:biopolymer transport protein ExbD